MKKWKTSYFWQFFPTGVEIVVGLQDLVQPLVKLVGAGQRQE